MSDDSPLVQDADTQTSVILGTGEDIGVDVSQGSTLETVKRSCYGHKGILKRRYKELEALMISHFNYFEVSYRLNQKRHTSRTLTSTMSTVSC